MPCWPDMLFRNSMRRANSRANASALEKTNYTRAVIVAYDDPTNRFTYRFVPSFARTIRADTNQESDAFANKATDVCTYAFTPSKLLLRQRLE
mmetsp:Transcript_18080/g.40132  ORF Transcript_18080/g.40132 Transcript_18080/m.40132 type:complete len:93 (-) Transcript_18080:2378-2656(-)